MNRVRAKGMAKKNDSEYTATDKSELKRMADWIIIWVSNPVNLKGDPSGTQ